VTEQFEAVRDFQREGLNRHVGLSEVSVEQIEQARKLVPARHGATVFQIALAWLLARSPAMLVIPGTSSVEHLEENVAAAEIRLTRRDMKDLDSLHSWG
jgi:aryl-alcohol dehydrogenase-like predicted oxidoreductase